MFVFAFAEMARHGFGDGMKPWSLDRVVNIADSNAKDGTILWARDCFFSDLKCKDFAGVCSDAEYLSPHSVTLQFTTPLCLEQRGRLVEEVNSEVLCRAILRRVSRLALLWCGVEWDMDYGAEIAFWRERIRCESAQLQMVEWRRYSARQGQGIPLKGFQGSLNLEGDLERARYLLKLGEFLHIGRHSVFGFGKYQCIGEL